MKVGLIVSKLYIFYVVIVRYFINSTHLFEGKTLFVTALEQAFINTEK